MSTVQGHDMGSFAKFRAVTKLHSIFLDGHRPVSTVQGYEMGIVENIAYVLRMLREIKSMFNHP